MGDKEGDDAMPIDLQPSKPSPMSTPEELASGGVPVALLPENAGPLSTQGLATSGALDPQSNATHSSKPSDRDEVKRNEDRVISKTSEESVHDEVTSKDGDEEETAPEAKSNETCSEGATVPEDAQSSNSDPYEDNDYDRYRSSSDESDPPVIGPIKTELIPHRRNKIEIVLDTHWEDYEETDVTMCQCNTTKCDPKHLSEVVCALKKLKIKLQEEMIHTIDKVQKRSDLEFVEKFISPAEEDLRELSLKAMPSGQGQAQGEFFRDGQHPPSAGVPPVDPSLPPPPGPLVAVHGNDQLRSLHQWLHPQGTEQQSHSNVVNIQPSPQAPWMHSLVARGSLSSSSGNAGLLPLPVPPRLHAPSNAVTAWVPPVANPLTAMQQEAYVRAMQPWQPYGDMAGQVTPPGPRSTEPQVYGSEATSAPGMAMVSLHNRAMWYGQQHWSQQLPLNFHGWPWDGVHPWQQQQQLQQLLSRLLPIQQAQQYLQQLHQAQQHLGLFSNLQRPQWSLQQWQPQILQSYLGAPHVQLQLPQLEYPQSPQNPQHQQGQRQTLQFHLQQPLWRQQPPQQDQQQRGPQPLHPRTRNPNRQQ